MLRVDGLSKRLGDFAIRDVSFEAAPGEYLVLLGESGVGKTILLETIAGLIPPDGGRIFLGGRDITSERIQRRRIGLVFQGQSLFPHLSVRGNVAYGLGGRRGADRAGRRARVADVARQLGIELLLDRRPGTLSGGEAQRVALARALAPAPEVLLLDEPLSSLDAGARSGLRRLLRQINRDGVTVVHVTHDYEEAIALATRVGVMERGKIVQAGEPREVFRRPASSFVARFAGIGNFLPGILAREGGRARIFCDGISLDLVDDGPAGEGHVVIRGEDVTLSVGRPDSGARNVLAGVVVDTVPVRFGVEVTVDVGVELSALLAHDRVEALGLRPGVRVWASVRAGDVRFLRR
ncbi:MAG: ABC transporter ATP-binding protein [Candidatus Krumholzibacteriota bacterium]|nr:ABC transporter ATP-binding protein [Candidatus Krumholzibacteriota bacterium]